MKTIRVRKNLLVGMLLLMPISTFGQDAKSPSAESSDISTLLAKADQAFAAADYQTAIALYDKLAPKLAGSDKLAGVQERMRFATKALAEGKTPAATQPLSLTSRKPHVKPAEGQTLELTLHELGNFEYSEDNDSSIPEDVTQLTGTRIKIAGQMLPLDQTGKVSRFILVNDLMSCCYGTAPKIQNIVYVTLPEGKWAAATTDRITVEGTLKVSVRKEDGFVLSLFEMTPTNIKLAPQ